MSNALIEKAAQAARSAKLLLDSGDDSGACNRAYYAMFDAASAALRAVGAPIIDEKGRITTKHSGVISSFGLLIAKAGHLPLSLGRTLNKAETIRLVADYEEAPVPHHDVEWIVQQSEIFVESVRLLINSLDSDIKVCSVCGVAPCVCGESPSRKRIPGI